MKRNLISGSKVFTEDGTDTSDVYDLGADTEKRGVLSIHLNTQPVGTTPTGTTVAHVAKLQTRERTTDAWVDVTSELVTNAVHTNVGGKRDVAVTVGLLRYVRLHLTASIVGGTVDYKTGVTFDYALAAAEV